MLDTAGLYGSEYMLERFGEIEKLRGTDRADSRNEMIRPHARKLWHAASEAQPKIWQRLNAYPLRVWPQAAASVPFDKASDLFYIRILAVRVTLRTAKVGLFYNAPSVCLIDDSKTPRLAERIWN